MKAWKILVGMGVLGAAAAFWGISHSWAKDHIQGDILQSTAVVFNITDRNLADRKALDDLKIIIDDIQETNEAIKSPAVERQLKRLKRRWEEDHKRLKRAVDTRHQMIARMQSRKTVTMR